MKKYLTVESKKNELRLLLGHPNYEGVTIIVLEGHTDLRLFRGLFSLSNTKLETFEGKLQVIAIVQELAATGHVIGICDADFDHIRRRRPPEAVFLTDTHDIETMMLESPAFDSVIAEFAFDEEIYDQLRRGLLDILLPIACFIGTLRLINEEESLGLNFEGLNPNDFVSINSRPIDLTINRELCVRTLVRRSSTSMNEDTILDLYQEASKRSFHQLQLCCGHDVTKLIAVTLNQPGLSRTRNINSEKIESILRASFRAGRYFRGSALCASLVAWEKNVGRMILA